MIRFTSSPIYRSDIDGLRAIAVFAIIAFHIGYFPSGYLGVDVFFVISGFLITGVIYREINEQRFSIGNFYLRRIRRIIPLVSFISVVVLAIGIVVMLPDDLENLAQSVIATNFFGNNVLQAITTRNYWDVVNEYKPLVHTWSLGIEEQYYLLYPFLFMALGKKRIAWAPYVLSILAVISLSLFFGPITEYERFYYLKYRFFELAIGGVFAIALNGRIAHYLLGPIPILSLLLLLILPPSAIPSEVRLLLVIFVTASVLATANNEFTISCWILSNPVVTYFGKISFSLYMWHQVLLAFARYFAFPEITPINVILILLLMILVSVTTYTIIETPFRNEGRVKTFYLLLLLGGIFVFTNAASWYIYTKAGVLRDIPELGISRMKVERGMHAQYNDRIYSYDQQFCGLGGVKVLVVGNSFARDWANVLLESRYRDEIELSYSYLADESKLSDRIRLADVVFIYGGHRDLVRSHGLDEKKIWSVGTKNFGNSNGYFYNNRGDSYCTQRTHMERGFLESYRELKQEFPDRYIDLIGAVIDEDGTVPVFTPDCRFISQDCRHLTIYGAQLYANIFEDQIGKIIEKAKIETTFPRCTEDSLTRSKEAVRGANIQ